MRFKLALLLGLGGCARVQLPRSDHCDGARFFNRAPTARALKSLGEVLRWRFGSRPSDWPTALPAAPAPDLRAAVAAGTVRITMINHATLLVQFPGLTVLTDPVFSERVSPVSFAGPRRVRPPGIALEALPHVDVVVLSHGHYDHLDLDSLAQIVRRDRPPIVAPLGHAALLAGAGLGPVQELDWWQSSRPLQGLTITLTEAQHWSARGLFDHNRALWGGFGLAAAGLQIYFAGDSGYGPHFARVRERLGPIDVALLPIGAYAPRWFMQAQHMAPEEAVQAHRDLQAQRSLGIHFGTFQLTDEAIDDPPNALRAALRRAHLAAECFIAPFNGQVFTWPPS